MELEKLKELKIERSNIEADILEKNQQLQELNVEIQKAETMQMDVDAVPQAKDTRKNEILKYYDPKTDTWSKESDKIFDAKDKEELKKLYNENGEVVEP